MIFEFEYQLKDLSFEESDEGLFLVDENGKVVFSFDQLVMYDAKGQTSEEIRYEIKEISNHKYQFSVIPDEKWLMEASYPVTIDPTLDSSTTSMSIYDTYIKSYYPESSYSTSSYMYMGGYSSSNEYRGLMYFYLPLSIMNQTITYANLFFTKFYVTNNSQINLYENTDYFTSSEVTWNSAPDYDPNMIDYYIVDNNTPMMFDITESVKNWQTIGNTKTKGFTLTLDDYGITNSVYQNGSIIENRPVITIGYESSAGLKDYWTYTSQDMGAVGTGYISDYTGNLTWIRNEFSLDNEYLSLNLSMYYSISEKDTNIGYGYGWKTNFNMQVLFDNILSQYYLYKPDGEKVYFSFVENGDNDYYIAENGSGIRLYETPSTLIIKTQNDMTYLFENNAYGRLYRITEDTSEQDIAIQYTSVSSLNILRVSDEVGNFISLEYNSNQLLSYSRLYLEQGVGSNQLIEYKNYTYDSSSNLNYVSNYYNYNHSTPSSADYIRYGYIDHKMNAAQNFSTQNYLYYTYLSNNKVSHIEINDNNELISEYDISYDNNQTIYTNYDNSFINYTFDTYGHTVNIIDSYGNTQYFKYSGLFYIEDQEGVTGNSDFFYYNGINLYPNYQNVHHLLEKSDVLKQVQNPVSNHGFEIEDGWTFINTSYSDITYTDEEYVLGDSSLAISLSSAVGYPYASQSIYLDSGTYTLTGYIKNNGSGSISSGAYMTVTGASVISTDDKVHDSDEWEQFTVEFSVTNAGSVTIKLYNMSISTAYFDNIQINNGFNESRYNQVTNNGFEFGGAGWTTNGVSYVSNNETGLYQELFGAYSLKIDGDGSAYKYFSQDFTDNVAGGETYLIGGWAKADSVPNKAYDVNGEMVSDGRFFGLLISIHGGDGLHDVYLDYYLPFDASIEEWQYQMISIDFPIYVSDIDVYGIYQGEGSAYFDNIQFYRDDVMTTYDYNQDGLLTAIKSSDGGYVFDYNDQGDLISIQENNQTTNIEYRTDDTYIEIEQNNVRVTTQYDSVTHHINASYIGFDMSETTQDLWYKTTYTYAQDDQYIDTVTDEFGNTIDYDYNQLNGLLTAVTDAKGNMIQYDYNKFGQVLQKEFGTSGLTYEYTYDLYHRLSTVSIDNLTYTFEYNNQDQLTSVKINSQTIVSYSYIVKTVGGVDYLTGLVHTKTYANGDYYTFEYNNEDLLISVNINGETENRYEYVYDASQRLSIVKDIYNHKIYFYSYDLSGRLEHVTDEDGNVLTYDYDEYGNLSTYAYQISGINRSVYYHYNDFTGIYDYTTYNTNNGVVTKDYNYDDDSLKRLNQISLMIGSTEILNLNYIYADSFVDEDMGNATTKIYQITYDFINNGNNFSYQYQYDANQNLINVMKSDVNDNVIENSYYTYDEYNQLIREDIYIANSSETKSVTYQYDYLGNMTDIKTYAYTTSTLPLNPLEKQHMTYDGIKLESITYYVGTTQTGYVTYQYDASGNPIATIAGGVTTGYLWDGRRLTGINYFNDSSVDITYRYNDQGVRVSKETNTHDYEYIVDGYLVLVEIIDGTNYIYYTYDVDGTLISMNYQGIEYYYISNMQGDIIGMIDGSGNIVVKYSYDAWGNILYQWTSVTNLDDINPYRYRGYRYDEETNLYYLNARYYDPSIARFISADDVSFISDDQASSINLYVYTLNNPVMYTDISGMLPEWLNDALRFTAGLAILSVSAIITYYMAPLFLIPGAASVPLFSLNMTIYGIMLVVSPFSHTIKSDMQLISWNPFNRDANKVVSSTDISFYKGVFVVRYGRSGGSGISFGIIGLGRGASVNTLMHEYGHHKQQRLLGMGLYTIAVAVPSLISAATSTYSVHANRWYEKWATNWGNKGWIWW